jgi:isoleucyl-tRNA synthetase
MTPLAIRNACRDYAQRFLELQRSQFVRLGVFGRWQQPYSTMSPEYESHTVETFFQFFERGFVYKGLKPVFWCIHDRTALAEAEVEYEMHTSPSVWVKYAMTSDPAQIDPRLAGKRVNTIIWTTTPWTLPASLAVAFHPEFEYVALEHDGGEVYIVAEARAAATKETCGLADAREIARFPGARMDRATFQHPFLDRSVLGVLADYVTTDQGTGAVHTAPAHGVDDFNTGARYGLDQTSNVDDAGRLRNGLAEFEGKTVFQANPFIIELLKQRGALMASEEIHHSYPHCWRCHNPVIFRATEQWFISMETPMEAPDGSRTTFRQRVLDQIQDVAWDPAWGQERIHNMVATRPDWCISRQRVWGVPIPVFMCQKCHQPLNDTGINRSIVELFAREGADAWYSRDAKELLPAGTKCNCGGDDFRKEMDILDVWFESGASQAAVLGVEPDLPWPADLYLEGGDQHRGWFQSSLLCGVGVKNASPYRKAATVGWVLDEQGRALSKSLGNGEDPAKIADRLGAEIIRLWVASVDFREDVVISENLLARTAESYRKLRNTLRYLLGSLHEFDPTHDAVPFAEMDPFDRYILARAADLTTKVREWYDEFAFHRVSQAINEFCTVDLSAIYLDLLKDRMYTFAPKGRARRSAQTAIWKIAEALVRLLAPVLSFTADEAWEYLPKLPSREASVHLALFPAREDLVPGELPAVEAAALLEDWAALFAVRDLALLALEQARQEKKIGKALEAKVRIAAPETTLALLQQYEGSLKELMNVSQVEIERGNELAAEVLPADGSRCERCWNYRTDLGLDARWPTVCGRCVEALESMFPQAVSR